MKKMLLAIAAGALFVTAGIATDRANALSGANSAGMSGAIEGLAEPVHCRPGLWHHRPTQTMRANGCRRVARAPARKAKRKARAKKSN